MAIDFTGLRKFFPGVYTPRETFDGLPCDVWQVHLLQQKTSWSSQDHKLVRKLARHWSPGQRRKYERQWNWGRPARWR